MRKTARYVYSIDFISYGGIEAILQAIDEIKKTFMKNVVFSDNAIFTLKVVESETDPRKKHLHDSKA